MIVTEERKLIAYQVGETDIVAAYDPAGAAKVFCEYCDYPDGEFTEIDCEIVPDSILDSLTCFIQDENRYEDLEKTLREEIAELQEPTYMYGWE